MRFFATSTMLTLALYCGGVVSQRECSLVEGNVMRPLTFAL